jgi:lipopolysaccharide/colanic/teichoic acid biosynthesis glycosyltransferase
VSSNEAAKSKTMKNPSFDIQASPPVASLGENASGKLGLGESRKGYQIAKRLFDLIFAVIGLTVLLPVALLIGLLIKLEDRGQIFYSQKRIGKGGKPFLIRKFRSMIVNADKVGVLVTKQGDNRTTRLGRVLRKFKLDELPQLWNVLAGDMSFVGPRPEVERYVDHYTPEQREILKLKPGITDMATMLFRNEELLLAGCEDVEGFYLGHCVPKKIELNLQYAHRASVLQDIWIIVQTMCPYWLGVSIIYAIALVAGLWLSYELRSDFQATRLDYEEFKRCLPWIVFPQLILLFWRGQMRGLLSYFSIPEMRRTVTALSIALALQIGLCYLVLGKQIPTRSLFIMDFMLSFFVLSGVRMAVRLLRESSSKIAAESPVRTRRVAIIGTGELATNLALNLANSAKACTRVIAFFDDNPRTWHKRPYDIPVAGMPECLMIPRWQSQIDEVIVAIPETDSARLQEIREMLKGLPLKVTFASGWAVLRPPQY